MILVNKNTRIVVQGATGKMGAAHTKRMVEYGSKVVAGVTPGRGGQKVPGTEVPVFDTVKEAVDATKADCSVIFVPPYLVLDAGVEAIEAGVKLLVVISEGIPPQDTAKLVQAARAKNVRMIGPNCPGVISPGQCLIGILPGSIFKAGNVGMVSRSGTLTYEIGLALTEAGMGQSTCVGIGGDPVKGTDFIDMLRAFNDDPDTHAIVMVGEIGGSQEEKAAAWIKENVRKPVVSFISGRTAPPGKRMGHAGAIISGGSGTAESKIAALTAAGIHVAATPREVAEKIRELLTPKAPVEAKTEGS